MELLIYEPDFDENGTLIFFLGALKDERGDTTAWDIVKYVPTNLTGPAQEFTAKRLNAYLMRPGLREAADSLESALARWEKTRPAVGVLRGKAHPALRIIGFAIMLSQLTDMIRKYAEQIRRTSPYVSMHSHIDGSDLPQAKMTRRDFR